MKEKLVIKNFGPIKAVELELGRFNVLIGENATGKSTVAKVLAVCRYFSYISDNNNLTFSKATSPFFTGLAGWGLEEFLKKDTSINYVCSDYTFTVRRKNYSSVFKDENGKIISASDNNKVWQFSLTKKSTRFANLIKEFKKIQSNSIDKINNSGQSWTIPTTFLQNDVASLLDNPFYLPTERGLQSIFSLGKNSIQNISDSLFNQFAKLDLSARNFKNETLIEPLQISYKNIDGRGYIKKSSEVEFYSLFNGASGYKSAIPIVLVIKYYSEIRKKRKTFLLEEPESNLFPTAQDKLMQYLVDKTMNYGNSILVTTHSPYILTSLNNMMYAFQVGETRDKKTENILPKKYWLNPNEVSVYMMLPNGKCESIIDKEGLIKAEKIDSISTILNRDFNAIMDIELNIKD
ncbi:MAG: AAA family ATPase [Ginsengibacter sp.]